MKAFFIIFKTEFLLFLRNFFSFFFALVFPVLMLVLFGYGSDRPDVFPIDTGRIQGEKNL